MSRPIRITIFFILIFAIIYGISTKLPTLVAIAHPVFLILPLIIVLILLYGLFKIARWAFRNK